MARVTSTQPSDRHFDLNIEKVLEHWTMAHALREIIANALDEQALTGTAEPQISKDADGAWHVRDYGRGLRYEHLTQKEDKEKHRNPERVIGKFGVGLKDALATADRRKIHVRIRSRHGDITTDKAEKHGFSDVITLHAIVLPPSDPDLVGTDFVLSGLSDGDVNRAKGYFLHYSGDEVLQETRYGSVLRKKGQCGRVYVNGLCVAEEENFLFSYNITSLTKQLLKALNRERTNVGRTAYADRVKSILLECSVSEVGRLLAEELRRLDTGTARDEVRWNEVAVHACRVLNANEKVLFVTSSELRQSPALVENARADGYKLIVIPDSIHEKLGDLKDIHGDPVLTLAQYTREWQDSFQFQFVSPDELTPQEQAVYALTQPILQLIGRNRTEGVKDVLVSETMRLAPRGSHEVLGVWEGREERVVIRRTQLRNPRQYAATLLHEICHAYTCKEDLSAGFEDGLTELLGEMCCRALSQDAPSPRRRTKGGSQANTSVGGADGRGGAPAPPPKRATSVTELRAMQRKLQALLSDATPYEADLLCRDLDVLALAIEASDAGAHVSISHAEGRLVCEPATRRGSR